MCSLGVIADFVVWFDYLDHCILMVDRHEEEIGPVLDSGVL